MSGAADLAARLVVGLAGPWPTPRERAWLARWRPAGVILFARNVAGPAQLAALTAELRAVHPELEIVADQEGGPVAPCAAAVGRPPAAGGLGLLDDADLTRAAHEATAGRLAALGVGRVLAPVADVLSEPRNPVLGVRAFGAEAERVARHVTAAVAGLVAGGCRVCLKHWPGHGASATDSHLEPSTTAASPQAAPFRAGLAAGADAVMVGHLHRPDRPPATLDPAVAAAVRALAPGRALQVLADDVTMGALRPALAARGVPAPPGTGLVDPAVLDAAWFAALAAGGADRLLVRGVPWRAFPADGDDAIPAPPAAGTPPAPDPAWQEAWTRLAGLVPAGFVDPAAELGRLDRTVGDRWGPADDADGGLVPPLAGLFARVVPVPGPPLARLLVTSHRPLDRSAERAAGWAASLAPSGTALAVGHPALAADLSDLLPDAWEVAWLPEWRAAQTI